MMKFENIIKKLAKDGYKVEPMEFSFQTVLGVTGTALVDIYNNNVQETTARYADVVSQIKNGKSHIQTITTTQGCIKKRLTEYQKL